MLPCHLVFVKSTHHSVDSQFFRLYLIIGTARDRKTKAPHYWLGLMCRDRHTLAQRLSRLPLPKEMN
jgi:hypothetical protein